MKKITLLAVTCLLTSNIFAYDSGKLRINITNNSKSSNYLCISGTGCINIAAGSKRTLPITPGGISYIFLAEGKTYRMYPQTLPSSCNITVKARQTLVVSGRVSKTANDDIFISQLRCSVVNS